MLTPVIILNSSPETQTDIARSNGVSHVTIGRLQGPVLRPFDGVGVPAV
jgi:hypothetical protein